MAFKLKNLKEKKWFQTLMGIAPTVATALGGPFAGLAMNVVKSATGLESEDALEAALIGGDPQSLIALKTAEQNFLLQMKELDIKEEQLVYDDIRDARARQVATKDKMPAVLTMIALAAFAGLSYMIFTETGITPANERFVWLLLGSVIGWNNQGFGFHLGSSWGSKRKTDIIANGNG